ncbi:88341407-8f89-45d9-8749-b2b4ed3042ee [Thermothielavioides terrestris]|uniref:Defect at low temperature protein 1 n=2 Tax=Thermothielavioides terrestris TaxID=2587410 RepID=G2RG04_THETT|nr:uncharacterized protein THITE_2124577 [Thermothielavioides terrestris NRRL 8126]AEO71758.1 hypothetical protein THITE_2124577 [Thermothielavioides terrestris NRRL 8126]SPQ27256.1 88341407-8f89-45d9-8749-b2b4ed3042ee [Thermothielavioides terrestris]
MSAASLLFLIVYNFLYYFLYLVLFAFLVVTPIDVIQQAVQRRRNYDILVLIVCYVATILAVALVYATRLYISRSVLASIPKSWIPIEKGDVPPDVRQMIVDGLGRSAAIAYAARPRVPPASLAQEPAPAASPPSGAPGLSLTASKKSAASEKEAVVGISPQKPVWGEIEHPGWASPMSPDLPDVQYDAVVQELPNLIEAKAITLAPPDPGSHAEPPALDPDAIALLQRPEYMGLREYLAHLTDLAVLAPLPVTDEFLAAYEAARFSARPLSNEQFRNLMHLFAEILRNMHPLSPAVLAGYEDDGSSRLTPSESDIDNDAPRGTSPSSLGTARGPQVQRGDDDGGIARSDSSSTASSARPRPGLRARNSSANTWQFRTAPTTPRSRHTGFSRASSSESFAHTRRPYPASEASSASLRSVGRGSVIRLAGSEDATDLPYVLMHSPSR